MIQKLKGTKDIIPGEIEKWQYVESQVNDVMRTFNYSEIRVPVIEAPVGVAPLYKVGFVVY